MSQTPGFNPALATSRLIDWTSWSLRFLTCNMGMANAGLGVVMKMTHIMDRKARLRCSGNALSKRLP